MDATAPPIASAPKIVETGLMVFAAVVELLIGVRAERQSLEAVAPPLSEVRPGDASPA